MEVFKFKVCYFINVYWQSYSCSSLQRLEVERCLLGLPFSLFIGFKKLRIYLLRSAHAQNKSAECLESCIWVGNSQSFYMPTLTKYLDSHLLFNEGVHFYKLVCCFEFKWFCTLKFFFV